MKKLIFMAIVMAVIFSHCYKQQDSITPPPPPPPKDFIANAGADTTICTPYGGTGKIFKAILNGKASRDGGGKIISYTWSEIVNESTPYPRVQITDYYRDSTTAIFDGGTGMHLFNLEVRDDRGQVANSQVRINFISPFNYAYDGLSWDSTTNGLNTISVKLKPGLMEFWPKGLYKEVWLKNFQGCAELRLWQKLPYVPYDSIGLTDKPLFFTLVSGHSNIVTPGILYSEIFCKSKSGIDISQKVSIGFSMWEPSNQ